MTTADLPLWYETEWGVFCQSCVEQEREMADLEGMARPKARGRRPWAGNPRGDRYWQCDNCLGQWGPDA